MIMRRKGVANADVPASDAEGSQDTPELEADDFGAAIDVDRTAGPFDAGEAHEDEVERIDLGSVLVPVAEGLEIRLEVDQESNQPVAVTLIMPDGALQVRPFSAPRSGGVWDEARGEIGRQVTTDGGTVDERLGPFGIELLTHVPAQDEQGRPVVQPMRFVGVDGPRWMLQGVFLGAGTDPEQAGNLEGLFRDVVVVRGELAMPPGHALPLRLPDDIAEQIAEDAEE